MELVERKCEEDNTNRRSKKSRKDEYEEWTGINDTPNGERDNMSNLKDSDIGTHFILAS